MVKSGTCRQAELGVGNPRAPHPLSPYQILPGVYRRAGNFGEHKKFGEFALGKMHKFGD